MAKNKKKSGINWRRLSKKEKLKQLRATAKRLRKNLPKSEKWFNSLFMSHKLISDKTNEVFCGKIPDVLNMTFKYIIEIDGTVHDLEKVKKLDAIKTEIYQNAGYEVIRVKAYNLESFNEALEKILKIRKSKWLKVNYLRTLTIKEAEELYGNKLL